MTGAARAAAYWAGGGQTAGEQTTWKRALAQRHARGMVVDAGCGTGQSSVAGAIGLDGAADALAAASGRGIAGVVADIERPWPLRTGGAGTMCLFDVLEHVPDPRAVLAEAVRVLADDGTLLVAVPNGAHLANRWSALRGRPTDFTDAAHTRGDVISDHLHRFSLAAAQQLLEEAGLVVAQRHDFFPSEFREPGWQALSLLAPILRRLGGYAPALLPYEWLFVCRRSLSVAAPPLPTGDTAAFWADDDARYRGYRATATGVRLDHRVRQALALLPRRPGGVLVDIGGGDGWISAAAGERVGAAEVVAVDLGHPPPLAPLAVPVRYESVAPGDPLPFADASVDVVLTLETIEHLLDPDALLAEARRVLRPDGVLVLSTPRLDSGLIIAALAAGIQPPGVEASARRRYGSPIGEGRPSGHLHLFTKRALYEALAANGFRVTGYREGRFSSSWRQARAATRRLRLSDLPVEAFFAVYDLLPWRKDVSVVRAVPRRTAAKPHRSTERQTARP